MEPGQSPVHESLILVAFKICFSITSVYACVSKFKFCMHFSCAMIITLLLFAMRSQDSVVDTVIDYEMDS
jgi:hypothetical protein